MLCWRHQSWSDTKRHRLNEYGKYLEFLKYAQLPKKEWQVQNGAFIHAILKHVSSWKGVRFYPTSSEIAELCVIKKLPHQRQLGKLHLMQQFIPAILCEIKLLNTEYQPPHPITDVGRDLMENAMVVTTDPVSGAVKVPVQVVEKKKRTRAELPIVGVHTFANNDEYELFKVVGKHPIHGSPCVLASSIDWKHPVVYEEWQHRVTKGNKSWFCCRRFERCRPPRKSKKVTKPAVIGDKLPPKKNAQKKSKRKRGKTEKKPRTTNANGSTLLHEHGACHCSMA